MLAQIRRQERKVAAVLLLAAAGMLVSCASQKEHVALVNDPGAKAESAMPWNKQEKWETGGQFSNFSAKRRPLKLLHPSVYSTDLDPNPRPDNRRLSHKH